MALKGLSELLEKYKKGEIANADDFETELNKALPESWIPKTVYNELNEKFKLSDKQGKELATQLEELKGKAGLSDEYKAQIEKLTTEQKTAKEAFEKQLADMKHGYALSDAITKANGKDAKLVRALLDESKLVYNADGTISGLSEQIDAIKKSHDYLFTTTDVPPAQTKPAFGTPSSSSTTQPQTPEQKMFEQMKAAAGV